VVAEAGTAGEALRSFRSTRPDVTLVDIRLGQDSGLDLLDALLEEDRTAKILIVSSFDDHEYIDRSLAAGAKGYVLKADSPSVLVAAIETVASGGQALGPGVAAHVVDHIAGREDPSQLDRTELGVLRLVASGASNPSIGEALFMSETTVKRRLRSVFAKLGVDNRTEAVAEAGRRRLL
jgi:DNA-binding NarL/FixJ family response regulator